MLKKLLIMGIICITFGIGTTNVYAQPDCITGGCLDFEWSDSLGTFLCGRGDDKEDGACRCNTVSGLQIYACGCFSDSDCASGQYCSGGKCAACKTCSNCTSGSWENYGTGYQRKLNKSCSCQGVCSSSYSYQCAPGYYGSSSNGTSGCTRCDPSGGTYGTTASAGTTAKTGCYLPSGTSFSETSGSGSYTGNCYWAN